MDKIKTCGLDRLDYVRSAPQNMRAYPPTSLFADDATLLRRIRDEENSGRKI